MTMATNLKMQGELEPGLLMDMLQVMNRRRTLNGYVEVASSAVAGRIWLQDGMIIAANWRDRQGELAVESMLRLRQGVFEVGEATVLPARTIYKETVALLMMCMRSIGREALAPVVPTRVPQSPSPRSVVAPVLVVSTTNADEPIPAPVHQSTEPLRKRRSFLRGWNWRVAACIAVLALLVTGVIAGLPLLAKIKSEMVAPPVSVSALPAPAAPEVSAPVKIKMAPVVNDGWPDIMLSALAASGQRHYCAILNGQLLGVGEQVDGVTIRSIRANGVLLEYQGQRRFLCAAQSR